VDKESHDEISPVCVLASSALLDSACRSRRYRQENSSWRPARSEYGHRRPTRAGARIGASSAKAIVQFREKRGPFERVEDLLAIRGISPRKLEQIRPYVNISKPAPRRPSSSRGSAIFSA